jgi:hypothetical protein
VSTEVDTIVGAEIVDGTMPLSETDAKNLNANIRVACERFTTSREKLQDLLKEAHTGNIHVALGYSSWTAWFAENVSITPADKADRQAWAAVMSGRGMSQRAIAGVLGVSDSTVKRDVDKVAASHEAPDNTTGPTSEPDGDAVTTGLDGKQYPRLSVVPPRALSKRDIDREVTVLVRDIGHLRENLKRDTSRAIMRLRGEEGFDQGHRERIVTAALKVVQVAMLLQDEIRVIEQTGQQNPDAATSTHD